jgi:serine acetyltransferase
VIGNNVFLEPGCKILGDVTIGDNVVVRANSLVLNDVPSNSIAVGNPARILKRPPEDTATA